MAQAMERLLATPKTIPSFPASDDIKQRLSAALRMRPTCLVIKFSGDQGLWLGLRARRAARQPSSIAGRRLFLQPEPDHAREAGQQQRAHGPGAAVRVPREELKRRRAESRSGEDARANGRLVESAVFALGFAHVHRIEKRRVIDQAHRRPERDLRQQQEPELAGEQQRGKTQNERNESREQPPELVVPAAPAPEKYKHPEPDEKPKGTKKNRTGRSRVRAAAPVKGLPPGRCKWRRRRTDSPARPA